jgi:AmmeMemoRadiSam system protein A
MDERIEFAGLMPHAPILVPGVGGRDLVRVEDTAHAMGKVASHALATNPDTVIVISPHSPRRSGAFGLWYTPRLHGSLGRFGSPEDQVDLPLDRGFADRLEAEAAQRGLRTWRITHEPLDHGALVPLCYLASAGWRGPTLVVGLNHPGEGGLDELGHAIAAAAQKLGRRTAIIASGDMSHRLLPTAPAGYDPEAHVFDEAFIGLLRKGAFRELRRIDPALVERAAEDVVDSTSVALAASGYGSEGRHEVLSYEGPFGVGYGVAILFERDSPGTAAPPAAGTEGQVVSRFEELPAVARRAVEAGLRKAQTAPPFRAGGVLKTSRAVFVTVRSDKGELRGCRGVTSPMGQDLVWETWQCAQSAAFFDGRFTPVRAAELPQLRFTVTVLGQLEPVASPRELDPAVYGVLVSAGDGRRGVLLPAIKGVDSVGEQLAIVRQKAGIADDEIVHIERFKTESFEEPPAGPQGRGAGC